MKQRCFMGRKSRVLSAKTRAIEQLFGTRVTTHSDVPTGHRLNVEVVPDQKPRYGVMTPWLKLGAGGRNRRGKSVNGLKVFKDLTSNYNASWSLFSLLERRSAKDNVVVLPRSALSKTEYQRLVRGLPTLIDQGLIKRLGHERYLVNPDLLMPEKYEEAVIAWNNQALRVVTGATED